MSEPTTTKAGRALLEWWWRADAEHDDLAERVAAIEAEARAGYLDLNSPDSERRFIEAGFLDAYLNIHGVADEAEALKMLRHDIAALKEEVVNAEVVIANEADIVADINDRTRHQNWPADDPQP